MFRNIPFSSSTFPKILGHHTTYWWILAHVWRSICWTYVPRPQLTGGWTKCFIGYFSWIEEMPLWWEIGMHSSKKTGASPDVAEISINQYVRMMNQSHQPCQCTNEYRFLRINVLSLGNLLYNLGLDHILLESPIYILYPIDIHIYINIYSSINLYPISYPPKMSFELRHVASAILARSSMASTFTSVTTHDPRRDPATHRSLPWPRRTEKPHSVLQEFDGDTIPRLPNK